MAQRKTLDEQIELALAEREKKEERIKLLLARRRTKEDKARTHRLCKRGGLVEKHLPRLAMLTDDQFDVWIKKTLLSGFAERALNEILPPPPVETEGGTGTADGDPSPKSESVTPAPQNNGGGSAHGGNNTRQTG